MTPEELLESRSAALLAAYRALLRDVRESVERNELSPAARGILAHLECEGGMPWWVAG